MKLRTQRVHFMGGSNRDKDVSSFISKDVFETSHFKSKSSYYKTAQSLQHSEHPSAPQQSKTSVPFRGSNMELEPLRWNSVNKRKGKQAQWKLQSAIPPLDYTKHLNKEVADINQEFKGKDINMFKLNQLKHTFVKNNKKRRNLRQYFQRFAKENKIGVEQLQEVVNEYGYDISEDEAKIMCRLTGADKNQLSINQFVELMSRENVHFSTLKLDGTSGKPRQHFKERIHLVFRNKFNKLTEAFKIYRSRGEPIDEDKYNYVMKKLDINDLVVSREQRQELFDRFKNKHGHFNAEAMFCAIVEQQNIDRPTFPPKLSDFDTNLRTHDENMAKKSKRTAYFDFKRSSNLQFQNQFFKAQQIIKELKKLGPQGQNIVKKGKPLNRNELIQQTQNLLKSKGINYTKQDYDCYSSYFNYNNAEQITDGDFKKYLNQTEVKAEARFDRRVRPLAPLDVAPEDNFCDQQTALQSLEKVRNKKLDPETKTVFKDFDKDKDGFISRTEFKNKVKQMAVLQGWQLQNLTNYFDNEGKGFVDYSTFAKKYDNTANKTDLNYYVEQPMTKLKSHSDWLHTKKSVVRESNVQKWGVPSKYSAWPQRLRHTDMSMIQAPSKAGTFISEAQRFNSTEKHSIGQMQKQERRAKYENKLKKLANWNDVLQHRVNAKEESHQNRSKANDYALRLTKEQYEERCHQVQ